MEKITFIQKRGKKITFVKFDNRLEKLVEYWKGVGTVRKFKDTLFIQDVSFPYTTELLKRWNIPFCVRTEL